MNKLKILLIFISLMQIPFILYGEGNYICMGEKKKGFIKEKGKEEQLWLWARVDNRRLGDTQEEEVTQEEFNTV